MAGNKGVPDEVLRNFSKDPGFKKLSEDAQDRIVTRWSQDNYGQISSSGNVIERIGKAALGHFGKAIMPELPQVEEPVQTPFQAGLRSADQFMRGPFPTSSITRDISDPGGLMDIIGGTGGELASAGLNLTDPFSKSILGIGLDPITYVGGGRLARVSTKPITKEISPFIKSISKLKKMEKGDVSIQERFRKSLFDKRASLTKEFEEDLSKLPEASHDIEEIVSKIDIQSQYNPSIKSQIQKSPIMRILLKKPSLTKNISTKQFQDLRNELGKGINYKSGKIDSSLRDLLDELRFKQAEPFPEEMAKLRTKYAEGIEAFKEVRPMFSKKSLESNIKKGFGGSEIRKSIEKALPGEEGKEILRIGKHNLIKNMILDVAKKSLPFTGATIGGIYALGKLSGRKD